MAKTTKAEFLRSLRRGQKTATVLLKCMVVDTDGTPVDGEGEATNKPWFDWDARRRPVKWLRAQKNNRWWSVPKQRRRRAA